MEHIISAFLFGIIAGILPGPILTSGFMTIIINPKGFYKTLPLPIIAATIEIIIGLTIFFLGKTFFTPNIIFILSIIGAINLFRIGYKIYKTRTSFYFIEEPNNKSHSNEGYMALSYFDAASLTILNGPLYLFWITVCLPLALQADANLENGGVYFILTMVFGVAITTWSLFYLIHISRNAFQKKIILKTIPIIISGFFFFLGIKLLIDAAPL